MTKLIKHISSRNWSIGGDGYERRWGLRLIDLQFFRRIEDQRWSQHYVERRVSWGIALGRFALTFGVTSNWFSKKGETKYTKEPGRA